jgi:hypothetical protein
VIQDQLTKSSDNASGSKTKRLVIVSILALLLSGIGVSGCWSLASDWSAQQISEMGGVPSSSSWENLNTLRTVAWSRQRAAKSAATPIPTLTFDVKFKDIQKLGQKRDEALRRNYLIQEEGDYVNATALVVDGDKRSVAKVKIRLKGDFTDHLKGDKWSFRVKTKGDDHILGMRVFSLQHPRVRGFAHEPIFLDHMRSEGVLSPRYSFVRLIVNGSDKGIMALEEHFSKELLESQQRRDSVIVRFDESLKWRTVQMMGQEVNFTGPYPFVRPFQASKLIGNPTRKVHLDAAVALLRSFLSNQLRPSQVFDPVITARFLAVCEIWGARHAIAWNNMRFYYNPLTGLLEPIAFDGNLQDYAFRFIPTCLVSVYRLGDDMAARWIDDVAIRKPFLKHLNRLSNAFAQQTSIDSYEASELAYNQILHQEFPLASPLSLYYFQQRSIRLTSITADNYGFLPLMPPNYPALVHAFLRPSPSGHLLEVYNLVPYPVEILDVQVAINSIQLKRKFPITLPPTTSPAAPKPLQVELTSPEDGPLGASLAGSITLTSQIQGYPESQTRLIASIYPAPATSPVVPSQDWETIRKAHPYLKVEAGIATLGPGEIQVSSPLILPADTSLTIVAGTTLRLDPSAFLLVRGSLHMPGTEDSPIRLIPTRGTWRGLAVFGSGKASEWTHVQIQGTNGLEYGPWKPTGSVMFYESNVTWSHCSIHDSESEDAINLVKSDFDFTDVNVGRASSGAIDLDFCKGTIRGGSIHQTKGDGLDISNTSIRVHGTTFERIEGSALSVGERSQLQASEVSIRDCGTGLASKDDSVTNIEDSSLHKLKHAGVIAYTQKPEFGGARIETRNLQIKNTKHRYIAQHGSEIQVDGKKLETVPLNLEEFYSSGHMKK